MSMALTVPAFEQGRVLVVGDVMLDRYWHGPTSRISPEAPVPVVKVGHVEDRPGGAANVAMNIAALGANVRLVGVTGRDEAAGALQNRLEAAGVDCHFVESADPTITKLRVISRQQQLIRLDFEEGFADVSPDAMCQRVEGLLDGVQVVILSDYEKGALRGSHPVLIREARRRGLTVLVDPKGKDFTRYRGATLLTPNLSEFETIVGHCGSEAILVERGEAMMQELELDSLLVTRGEHGMTLLRRGKQELHLPARAQEVYDVTGAGDTVIAVLAAALASGSALPQATGLANLAASIVVAKLGTASVSPHELRRAVNRDLGAERGVMNRDQLRYAVEDARAHGEKIVFTNGCFDILHAGHVTYLEQARAQGDRLVVAVNTDESVRGLKGSGRPINPVDRRMAVLAGLSAVDWVVPFHEQTPHALLELLKPDVLVKGGDYAVDQVVGGELVRAWGGDVRVLGLIDNCSTTSIVNKIKDRE